MICISNFFSDKNSGVSNMTYFIPVLLLALYCWPIVSWIIINSNKTPSKHIENGKEFEKAIRYMNFHRKLREFESFTILNSTWRDVENFKSWVTIASHDHYPALIKTFGNVLSDMEKNDYQIKMITFDGKFDCVRIFWLVTEDTNLNFKGFKNYISNHGVNVYRFYFNNFIKLSLLYKSSLLINHKNALEILESKENVLQIYSKGNFGFNNSLILICFRKPSIGKQFLIDNVEEVKLGIDPEKYVRFGFYQSKGFPGTLMFFQKAVNSNNRVDEEVELVEYLKYSEKRAAIVMPPKYISNMNNLSSFIINMAIWHCP